MPTLAEFIDRCIATADKQNLAVENPVTLYVEGDNLIFYVAVSHLEPNHVTLPLNVTWIVADPNSPLYKKAFRRVSALPFSGLRNTWAELRTYEDFLEEPQFWDLSSTFQLGEVQVNGVTAASVLAKGTFTLNREPVDPTDPVVVSGDDPRMSDARQPLPHTHPLLPSTMLRGSEGINSFYVTISDSRAPVAGDALFLTEQGDQPGEWMGVWRPVSATDVVYDGPTFDTLTINGPESGQLDEGTPYVFTADAFFSDGQQQLSVAAEWSIISNPGAGNISPSTGVFTSNDVVGDQEVRIRARWTHPASMQERITTFDLTVVDTTQVAVLDHIVINGVTNINEGGATANYNITAHYVDGTSRGVNPNTFTSSNPAAGMLNASTGVFTAATNVANNQLTTLTATYTENGITKSATLSLTVIDTTVYPQSAVIQGPASVGEGETATYVLNVTFTDLSTSQVAVSDWAIDNASAGSISSATGVLTAAPELGADETATLTASYSANGRTVTASLPIIVRDDTVYPLAARVLGPTTLDEGTVATFQLEVDFSDDTTQTVAVSNWATSNSVAGTINASTGEFTAAANLTANEATQITVSFTSAGVTLNASHDLTVRDITNYPVSAVIVGNASMNENTTQQLTFNVTYLNGTVVAETAAWSSSNTAVANVNSAGLVTAATNLTANGSTTIEGSFSKHGVTVTANLTLSVVDTTVYPVSAVILGQALVSENTSATYQLEVTFDNGTKSVMAVNTFASSNPAAGSITAAGVLTAPANVTEDLTTTITATFTRDGRSVTGTRTITVTDDTVYPSTARIVGPNSVNENTTQAYQFEVTFSDASVQTVTVSNWASSNPSVAAINANTGMLSALEQTANGTTTISASYTAQGQTVSANLAITVVDTTNYPVSAEIIGSASVAEGGTSTYQLEVTFTDGTSQVMPVTNWASSSTTTGVINSSTGAFTAAANVQGDKTTTISASYTAYGTTVSDTLLVTVTDETAYPVSATIVGPNTVNEGATATYTFRVTFDDSTTQDVAITNWASSVTVAGSIDSATGVFTANTNDTGSNIATVISGSYTVDGTTVNATKSIGVVDTTVYAQSATISGATSVNEGSVTQYTLTVTYTDSTTAVRTASWSIDNATAGSINAATGEFTASDNITSPQTVTITASYTEGSRTVTDTHAVTVADSKLRPVSATINGPATVDEGSTAAFTMDVTFDNGTSQTVSVTNWGVSNASAGTINASTGVFTAASVSADTATDITASYTLNGATANGSKPITVVNVEATLSSVTISGPASVTEGQTANYTAVATYSDDSTSDVTNSGTWSSSIGSINSSGLYTAPASVNGSAPAVISFSFTDGTTVSDTLNINVVDAVIPLARFGLAQFSDADFTGGKTGTDTAGNPYERWSGPQEFLDEEITNSMPNNADGGSLQFNVTNGLYVYFANPKELGIAVFTDVATGFNGGWDGMSWTEDGGFGETYGPLEVTYDDGTGPRQWYVYRTDFPSVGNINFTVSFPNN